MPVTLRPEAGELLLSWLHRIGSLYDHSPMELLGISGRAIDLAIQPGDTALQCVSKLTRWPMEGKSPPNISRIEAHLATALRHLDSAAHAWLFRLSRT